MARPGSRRRIDTAVTRRSSVPPTIRRLALPPWRRAPFRLFRSPAFFGGVFVAALVVGLAAGSRPLFVSSAASAALHEDLVDGCPYQVGLVVQRAVSFDTSPGSHNGNLPSSQISAVSRELDRSVQHLSGLRPRVVTIFGGNAAISSDDGTSYVQLVARTNATDHIVKESSSSGPGIWLPDDVASQLKVGVGDRVELTTSGVGQPVPMTVRGTFRDLANSHRDPTWCSMQRTFEGSGSFQPNPVALVDAPTLTGGLQAGAANGIRVTWEYPPDGGGWSLPRAERSLGVLRVLASDAGNGSTTIGRVLGGGTAAVDQQSSLDHAKQAGATGNAFIGPVALGAAGVALLTLLMAARTWLDRRSRELRILSRRGAGPGLLAGMGVLELATPTVLGVAAGLVGAWFLVRRVGPSPLISSSAVASAAELVLVALVAALVLVAAVVLAGVRRVGVEDTPGRQGRGLAWELIVLALAAAAYYELASRGSSAAADANGHVHIDSLVLLFPVLLLVGGAGVLSGLALSNRLLRRAGSGWPVPPWLAARRLASGRPRAVIVIIAASTSMGIVVFAAALGASQRATLDAKATLGPGSAQVFTLGSTGSLPASSPFHDRSTTVTRTSEQTVVSNVHAPADILGVDPSTFAKGAFWDSSFAGTSLGSLLHRISGSAQGVTLRAIAVGDGLPDRFSVDLPVGSGYSSAAIPVQVVARARAFPGYGYESDKPMVVVDRGALTKAGVTQTPQLWVNSPDSRVPAQLKAAGLDPSNTLLASNLRSRTAEPQLWALRYVQFIGLSAGAVTICGLGLYFAAVSDRRRLSTALARNMGLSRRRSTLATMAEIATMLTIGLVLGAVLAFIAIRLVYSHLDPLPGDPPAPLLRYDAGYLVLCALAVVVVTIVTGLVIEARASRSSLPELIHRAS
jgi:putative ABC transport system permease protein